MLNLRVIIIAILGLMLQSCKLWPYRSDFDCPIVVGYRCKSLYEINNLIDRGAFARDLEGELDDASHPKCKCKRITKRQDNAK